MIEMHALKKEAPEKSLAHPAMRVHGQKTGTVVCAPGSRPSDKRSAHALILDFPVSRTVSNDFLLFTDQLVF